MALPRILLPSLFACVLPVAARDPTARLVAHVAAHPAGRVAVSADLARLRRGPLKDLPIGVFDSGIGGLTVLEALLRVDGHDNRTLEPRPDGIPDLAGERFLYLGDQANMPYGNYPAAGRTGFLRELILKDAVFLLGRRQRRSAAGKARFDKPPVKAIVIACNTGTAYGLEDLRAALKAWRLDIPVIGVVEAGAEAVAERLPAAGTPPTVGVMATVGTCASGAYPEAIARAAARTGKPAPKVVQRGSLGLAGAIEGHPGFVATPDAEGRRAVPYQGPARDADGERAARLGGVEPAQLWPGQGWALNSVEGYVRFDVGGLLAGLQSKPEGTAPLGMVVLGCTHFPLVAASLQAAFARAAQDPALRVSTDLALVDPAEHTARGLLRELGRRDLRRDAAATEGPTVQGFFMTVPNPRFPGLRLGPDGGLAADYKTGRREGRPAAEDTVAVPLDAHNLPGPSRTLVQALPHVWAALQAR